MTAAASGRRKKSAGLRQQQQQHQVRYAPSLSFFSADGSKSFVSRSQVLFLSCIPRRDRKSGRRFDLREERERMRDLTDRFRVAKTISLFSFSLRIWHQPSKGEESKRLLLFLMLHGQVNFFLKSNFCFNVYYSLLITL